MPSFHSIVRAFASLGHDLGRGKENRHRILSSIDEGPFQMGICRDAVGATSEGATILCLERPITYDDLDDNDKAHFYADVCTTNIVLQGLTKDIYKLINHNIKAKAIWDNDRFVTAIKLNKGLKETNHEQLYAYLKQHEKHAAQDIMINERLSPPSNDPLAFVSSVQPRVQSSYAPHQSSVVQSNQYPSPSAPLQSPYKSSNSAEWESRCSDSSRETQSESEEHARELDDECDAFDSNIDDEPTAQTIFMANLSSAGPAHQQVGPSHASTLFENNEAFVVLNDVSSVLNDDSLTIKLSIYKEQVEVYEQRAKFELTKHEQKLNEQISILIHTRNRKEENLKKEHHSVKLQINSTIQSNKLIQENVTALHQDFKQNEDKILGELVNMRNLKEIFEDKLYKQEQSMQTVHMMCKPKSLYDHENEMALVPTSEEDLELTDISREKMIKKVKDLESLVKEVRAMKAVFENMKAEVDQNAIDKKCDEIERKNLLITNKNLIANCIAQESRAVKLEAENSKLLEKIQNDDHDSMVKHFSKLEIDHLNLQLKYQHLKENIGNFKSKTSKDAPEYDAFFELKKWNDQLQAHKNTIQVNSYTIASRSKPRSNTKKTRISLAKSVNKKKVEERPRTHKSCLKITNRKVFIDVGYQWKPTGRTFTLGTRNARPKVVPITLWKPMGRIIPLGGQCPLVRPTTSTSGLMVTANFVKKFIGTLRFENDHFGAIMSFGEYVIGDSVISSVYYVEGLGHNLFSVSQFCDCYVEVAFRKHTCFVRDLDSVDHIKGGHGMDLYIISIEDMMWSSPICLLSKALKNKSWLWHLRLNHLNFDTINDLACTDLVRVLPRLKFEKDHLCSAC
uniref:Integrase, catalytic region, zinc finger, CCHC-type, peptidase aspartic, catalytic n=1 Tax=Tanacetum cinerariifolium TaxID=118510 RepID=A0A6L2JUH8_TANCI|nr:integrase, catalytic region, zinc finger, CCHC-type, peptidase aspartic, catalytic [Tanacetum cinerariifolium]